MRPQRKPAGSWLVGTAMRTLPALALLSILPLAACASAARHSNDAPSLGEPTTSTLYREIAAGDAKLTAAFDRHDAPALMDLFDEELEFFHDKGGLQRYADVERGFSNLFSQNNGIRRELIPGTLRVFPIANYGAVELGRHRFCHVENGHDDCGTFEFVQVWRQANGEWKITRVVSYGH